GWLLVFLGAAASGWPGLDRREAPVSVSKSSRYRLSPAWHALPSLQRAWRAADDVQTCQPPGLRCAPAPVTRSGWLVGRLLCRVGAVGSVLFGVRIEMLVRRPGDSRAQEVAGVVVGPAGVFVVAGEDAQGNRSGRRLDDSRIGPDAVYRTGFVGDL